MIRTNVQTFAVAILLIAAAGCSGGGGGSASPSATPTPAGGGQSTPNPGGGGGSSSVSFKPLQACFPYSENTNCNTNANAATPAPVAAFIPHGSNRQLLVADDAAYASGSSASPSPCTSSTVCGGFTLDTSAGSCTVDNVEGVVDLPAGPPTYSDLGGSNQQPPVTAPVTHAVFPAAGPYAEFDIIAGAAGTVCDVTITETDATFPRTVRLQVPIR